MSPAHLHRYLAEFDFRYNRRHAADSARTDLALLGIQGKRLMYRESRSAAPEGAKSSDVVSS